MECSGDSTQDVIGVYPVTLEGKSQRKVEDESDMCCNAEDSAMRGPDVDMLRTNSQNICAREIDSAERKLLECGGTDLPLQDTSRVGPVGVKVETPNKEDTSSQLGSGGNAGGCESTAVLQSHQEIVAAAGTEIARDGNCDGKLNEVVEEMCVDKDTSAPHALGGDCTATSAPHALDGDCTDTSAPLDGEDTLTEPAVAEDREKSAVATGNQDGTLAESAVADAVSEEYIKPQYATTSF